MSEEEAYALRLSCFISSIKDLEMKLKAEKKKAKNKSQERYWLVRDIAELRGIKDETVS